MAAQNNKKTPVQNEKHTQAQKNNLKKNNKIRIRIRQQSETKYLRCRYAPEKHDRLKTVSEPHITAIFIFIYHNGKIT